MFKQMFTENEIKKLAQAGSGGDSTLVLKIEMEGGTLTADEMTALIAKPYNVVIGAGEATAYMNPVLVSPHYSGETITSVDIYVVGNTNPISLVKIEINVSTGVYTISM